MRRACPRAPGPDTRGDGAAGPSPDRPRACRRGAVEQAAWRLPALRRPARGGGRVAAGERQRLGRREALHHRAVGAPELGPHGAEQCVDLEVELQVGLEQLPRPLPRDVDLLPGPQAAARRADRRLSRGSGASGRVLSGGRSTLHSLHRRRRPRPRWGAHPKLLAAARDDGTHTELILAGLLLAVAALVTLARVMNVPYPIFLVLGGLAIGVDPGHAARSSWSRTSCC